MNKGISRADGSIDFENVDDAFDYLISKIDELETTYHSGGKA